MLRPVARAVVHCRRRAMPAACTGLAGGRSEPDVPDGRTWGILALMPADTVLALWTGYDLVVPVHWKLGDIERAGGCACPLGATCTGPTRSSS